MLESNLHLDADSANLAAFILQPSHQFRRELPQFGSGRGVGNPDAEGAGLQSQYLTALREVGWCNTGKKLLQLRQSPDSDG